MRDTRKKCFYCEKIVQWTIEGYCKKCARIRLNHNKMTKKQIFKKIVELEGESVIIDGKTGVFIRNDGERWCIITNPSKKTLEKKLRGLIDKHPSYYLNKKQK